MNRIRWPMVWACVAPVTIFIAAGPALAQHDPAREAIRQIAKGKLDKALVELKRKDPRRSPTTSAESNYIRALVEAVRQNPAEALKHAQKAVDQGLPFERFQAGPRDLLQPLYQHPSYQTWKDKQGRALLHGPMLGAVTESSARFWLRTAEPATVTVVVTRGEGQGEEQVVSSAKATSTAERDYTTVVEVQALSPNTRYQYSVLIGDQRIGPTHAFQTYPKAGQGARFKVGFGGGAGYMPENERMWTAMAQHHPLATLLLGDNVYIDDPTHPITHRFCYHRRHTDPQWRRFVASSAIHAIYDDHDFGTDDCVPGPDVEHPAWKRKVWEIFAQNWNNPAYGGKTAPGCWFDFHIGDVHFILLDGRYYRDLEGKSMLGPVQKAWLFDTLTHLRQCDDTTSFITGTYGDGTRLWHYTVTSRVSGPIRASVRRDLERRQRLAGRGLRRQPVACESQTSSHPVVA